MQKQKSGFVYIWYDRKHKRYYIGCHWGFENDGYICSSSWMKQAFRHRPYDFKRRIIIRNIQSREETYNQELRYLKMIKDHEIKIRYYNLNNKNNESWHKYTEHIKNIGQKISEKKTGKSNGPLSEETKKKISETKKQKFNIIRKNNNGEALTVEHKQKISENRKGKLHTEEWKIENSKKLKQQWSNGIRKSNGPLSEEHKKKISSGNKGKKLSDEQIQLLKINNSKQYKITYFNQEIDIVNGLKQYASDKNIPYVTLRKCMELIRPIKKYNIQNILELIPG